MTRKEIFVMGRAEAIYAAENISMIEACKIAEQEWEWKMVSEKEIDHFVRQPGSVCQNCQFRKEEYRNVPVECAECGHLNQRNAPYYTILPVFKEEDK